MIDLDSKVTPSQGLLEAAVGEEIIMMDFTLGHYFTLNEMASTIWAELKQGRTVGEICAALTATYDAPREQIETETLALVERLAERGIVAVA